ncbi:MAG TPA: AI-2E family transporter [Clostridiaceae bacterium]
MEFINEIFKKDIVKKVLVLSIFGLILFLLRNLLNLLLFTFVFTFLIYTLQDFITKLLSKRIKVNQMFLTIVIYSTLVAGVIFGFITYIPVLMSQITDLIYDIKFGSNSNELINFYLKYVTPITKLKSFDLTTYTGSAAKYAVKFFTSLGMGTYNVLIALVLSLFFMMEKKKVFEFTRRFKTTKIGGVYKYLVYFGNNFSNSFGKVIQAQILIAFINSILSVIALWIMGFNQLLLLAVLIFLFSLIPVAGVFISLIPLSFVAYSMGGFKEIIYVLIMICLLHTLEAYVLNPKLMSSKTDLPVFYVFMTLLISENFMGVWGLIIGIPLFMFLLDLIKNNPDNL